MSQNVIEQPEPKQEELKAIAFQLLPAVEEQLREGSLMRHNAQNVERPHRQNAVEAVRRLAREAGAGEEDSGEEARSPEARRAPSVEEARQEAQSADSEMERRSNDEQSTPRNGTVSTLADLQNPERWHLRWSPSELRQALHDRYVNHRTTESKFTEDVAKLCIDGCINWLTDPSSNHIPRRFVDMLERILLWSQGADQSVVDAFVRKVNSEQMDTRYKSAWASAESRIRPRGRGRGRGTERVPYNIWSKLDETTHRSIQETRTKKKDKE